MLKNKEKFELRSMNTLFTLVRIFIESKKTKTKFNIPQIRTIRWIVFFFYDENSPNKS